MACSGWNEQWVARLYEELDPEEERRMALHLEGCAACRSELEELERSRQLLGAASPAVPAAPRVVVLRAGGRRHFGWDFAAGLAAASVIFALGLGLGGGRLPGLATDDAVPELQARLSASEAERTALVGRIETLEARMTLPAESPADAGGDATQAVLTREELASQLSDLERRINYERARDVEFLLGEMNAVEWRAGRWVDETRQAMRIALETQPGFSER